MIWDLLSDNQKEEVKNYVKSSGLEIGQVFCQVKENTKEHIERFSDEQVNILQSLFCIVFTGVLYWINHKFQILPRHTMIWLTFLSFPLIVNLATVFKRKKKLPLTAP